MNEKIKTTTKRRIKTHAFLNSIRVETQFIKKKRKKKKKKKKKRNNNSKTKNIKKKICAQQTLFAK